MGNSEIPRIGIKANKDWPTNDTMDILSIVVETLRNNASSGFETWMIEGKDSKEIIGDMMKKDNIKEGGKIKVFLRQGRKNMYIYDELNKALDLIEEGVSFSEVERETNINRSILAREIRKRKNVKARESIKRTTKV